MGFDAVEVAVAPAWRVGLGGVPSPGPCLLGSLSTPPTNISWRARVAKPHATQRGLGRGISPPPQPTISWRAGVPKRHATQRGWGRDLPPAPPGGSAERLYRRTSEG